jgi:RHS repeat-associated protein
MTIAATCAVSEVSRRPSYYRAEQYDSDLSLYYLRARFYNAVSGRFLSRDLKGGYPLMPVSLPKYLYAGGDPINRIDPSGRDLFETVILDDRPFTAASYLNTTACFVGIVAFAASAEIDSKGAAGAALTAIGCLLVNYEAPNEAYAWLKTGLDLGTCAFSAYAAIADVKEYVDKPTGKAEKQLDVDALGGWPRSDNSAIHKSGCPRSRF